MREPYQDLDAAIEERRRMRARRRRLLYLRRTLIILVAAALLALVIATPFWIVDAVRNHKQKGGQLSEPTAPTTTATTAPTQPPIPAVNEETTVLGGELDGTYAVLLDVTDGRVVAAKNADVPANPASITKVMTLLVAVENIDNLDAEYTVPWQVTTHVALDATRAGLNSGDVFSLRDLLYGCILPSGGDAAVALAHYVSGMDADHVADAEKWFAKKMNERAKELGATNTNFVNVSGLHDRSHKTTAMDMALIMAAAMQNPICREVLSTPNYSSENTLRLPASQLAGGTWRSTLFTSWLGADRHGIMAGKTGYTDQAKHTLATYTEIGGHRYVFVSMHVSGSGKAVQDAVTVYEEFCK